MQSTIEQSESDMQPNVLVLLIFKFKPNNVSMLSHQNGQERFGAMTSASISTIFTIKDSLFFINLSTEGMK
jgi:hypothetical protein